MRILFKRSAGGVPDGVLGGAIGVYPSTYTFGAMGSTGEPSLAFVAAELVAAEVAAMVELAAVSLRLLHLRGSDALGLVDDGLAHDLLQVTLLLLLGANVVLGHVGGVEGVVLGWRRGGGWGSARRALGVQRERMLLLTSRHGLLPLPS